MLSKVTSYTCTNCISGHSNHKLTPTLRNLRSDTWIDSQIQTFGMKNYPNHTTLRRILSNEVSFYGHYFMEQIPIYDATFNKNKMTRVLGGCGMGLGIGWSGWVKWVWIRLGEGLGWDRVVLPRDKAWSGEDYSGPRLNWWGKDKWVWIRVGFGM